MLNATCASCRATLRTRLQRTIKVLAQSRRSVKSSSSIYWDTNPPSDQELAGAKWFFKQHPARKVWTAMEWRRLNHDNMSLMTPEVCFLGRSNVGKSSLLNAVLGSKDFNRVGRHPGKTKVMHAWGLAASDPENGKALKGWKGMTDTRVTVLDAPGYGYGSDRDWGSEIITYLKRRKQLRRIFVLIDAMHGPKKQDHKMFEMLRELNIPHQIIVSKVDRAKNLASILHSLQEVAQPYAHPGSFTGLGEILAVGGLEVSPKAKPQGVQDVQWAILRAAGLEEFVMNNFERLNKKEFSEHAAKPRQTNAESHLKKPQVLPPLPASMPAEPLPAETRSTPRLAETKRTAEIELDSDESFESDGQGETAPVARLNPDVYRGMEAFERAAGHKPTAKARPRLARPVRRSGSVARGKRTVRRR